MAEVNLTRKAGPRVYRSIGAVAARYSKHPITIDRWMKDPRIKFPPPDLVVNRVRHWLDATLDAFDAAAGKGRTDRAAKTMREGARALDAGNNNTSIKEI
jgi:hypothetical protein